MIITRTSEDVKKPLTDEQRKMLEALKDRPVTPDEDCPPITPEQFAGFRKVSAERRTEIHRQSLKLRPSSQTAEKVLNESDTIRANP